MKRSIFVIAIIMMAFAGHLCAAASARPTLVPWPQKVTMIEGSLTAPKSLSIGVAGKNAATRSVAETFAYDLKELGFLAVPASKSPTIILGLSPDKTLGDEGYRLSVDKNIRITAATEQGLFWGTRTALQLLAKGPGEPVQRMNIFDKPLLPMRGVMVDVARQFHTIGFHRRFVKRLASYKLNFYHIHLSDDQSYTLPSEKYPQLPTRDRHYTKDELKALVKLAARYHVTIIPEIDMPGHAAALWEAVPSIICRDTPGGAMCPSSNRSFAILRNLITEATDIFPGPYFHIGADEVSYDLWSKCPDCKSRKISEGLKDNQSLYNWFINRMNRFVRSKGRRTIVWTGFKPTTQPFIDKNVLVDQWDNGFADPRELLAAGYDLLNSISTPLYVVRDWSHSPEKIAEWDVWHFGLAHEPLPYLAPKMEPSKKLKGVGFCSWENSEAVQEAVLFGIGKSEQGYSSPAPRVPVMAERGWTGSATTADDLLRRVGVVRK
jgi:hexosaminidase